MNCGDGPEFSPKGDWVLFGCEPEGRLPPTSTGSTPTAQAWSSSPSDADVHYGGSSFSPEFDDEGWGDIVAARYPAYGDEGNSDVFRMHIEHLV